MGSDAGEHTAEPMTEPDSSADAAEPVALDGASDAPVAAPTANGSLRITAVVAAIVLALDQLTKHWALNALGDGRSRHVIGTLQWNLTFNSGMAFSRAQGIGPYIGVLALTVIVVMLLSVRRSNGRAAAIAVGLVVGGALGNLADRLLRERGWLRGRVVDFIDLQWWPIFNVADMGVSIGGVLIVLGALLESKRVPR